MHSIVDFLWGTSTSAFASALLGFVTLGLVLILLDEHSLPNAGKAGSAVRGVFVLVMFGWLIAGVVVGFIHHSQERERSDRQYMLRIAANASLAYADTGRWLDLGDLPEHQQLDQDFTKHLSSLRTYELADGCGLYQGDTSASAADAQRIIVCPPRLFTQEPGEEPGYATELWKLSGPLTPEPKG